MANLARTRCVNLGIAPALIVRIELALEELFVNTIHHGYRADDGGLIWIDIIPLGRGIRIIYADAAPPYNPLAIDSSALGAVHAGDNPAVRPIGGLGRLLVAHLCTTSNYCYDSTRQRNVLNLEFSP